MSTVDVVQQAFMTDMLSGSIQPGTWVRQDEVADRLGVSKIPVREALQRLAAFGLVRFETNRGAIVPELSAVEARENYTLRLAIEVQLLRQALPQLNIVDLAEAELALSSTVSVTESNWRFHRALYRASGWQRGLAMVEILHAAVAPYVVLYTQGLGGAANSDNEHHALLDACRLGDVEAAEDQLLTHLDGAAAALIEFSKPQQHRDRHQAGGVGLGSAAVPSGLLVRGVSAARSRATHGLYRLSSMINEQRSSDPTPRPCPCV